MQQPDTNAAYSLAVRPELGQVATLLALDGHRFGGVLVSHGESALLQAWLERLQSLSWPSSDASKDIANPTELKNQSIHARLNANAQAEQFLDGIDLSASLECGQSVWRSGLASRSDHATITIPMICNQSKSLIGALCATLDSGETPTLTKQRTPDNNGQARICAVVLDNSADPLVGVDSGLLDRLAFMVRTDEAVQLLGSATDKFSRHAVIEHFERCDAGQYDTDIFGTLPNRDQLATARELLSNTVLSAECLEHICSAAVLLGIGSVRPQILCARVARGIAALAQRQTVQEPDIDLAIALCLGWRAKQVTREDMTEGDRNPDEPSRQESIEANSPIPDETTTTPQKQFEQNHTQQPQADTSDAASSSQQDNSPLAGDDDLTPRNSAAPEINTAIESATLPQELLENDEKNSRSQSGSARTNGSSRAGVQLRSNRRGRQIGFMRGKPDGQRSLHLPATLRAAIPWQRHRKQQRGFPEGSTRLVVKMEDLQVSRYQEIRQNVTIFVVDASGSAAAQRLAEAKGAVELLLAQCYVRRDQVALIVFQGACANLVLSPTRSLAKARRELSDLPGGGGTPLASALEQSSELVDKVLRDGNTPVVCILTDGRANIDLDGIGGRERAQAQALSSAEKLGQRGARTIVIDIGRRPIDFTRHLTEQLRGTTIALPRADAAGINRALTDAH